MSNEIKYLSLFSGAGGGDLACQHLLGWSCVGYVDWNKDACETLDRRIRDGFADNAPVWHQDIRDFNRGAVHVYSGMVDFVAGGPPCQPFSVAGRRAAGGDSRNMVPAMLRTIGIVRPRRILLENSPTSTFRRYLLEFIIPRLRQMGYVGRYGVVSAEDAIWLNCYPGVPARFHERKRTWVIAKIANANSGQRAFGRANGRMGRVAQSAAEVTDAKGKRKRRISARSGRPEQATTNVVGGGWWSIDPAEICNAECGSCPGEPRRGASKGSENRLRRPVESRLGRVVHGMARRLDRCRAVGEGQVPAVVDIVEEILNNGF